MLHAQPCDYPLLTNGTGLEFTGMLHAQPCDYLLPTNGTELEFYWGTHFTWAAEWIQCTLSLLERK
jgi:hypothetical protein